MGRGRSTRRDNSLPEYVYRVASKNRVIWREYAGKGQFSGQITLVSPNGRPLPHDAPHRDILEAYQRQVATGGKRTLGNLLRDYMAAPRVAPIKPKTRAEYLKYVDAIAAKPMRNGSRFGDVALEKISAGVIAKYRDSLADKPTTANRHLQFLSVAFGWAIEQELMASNPCQGVRRYRLEARTRYVEDWEFDLVQELAPDYAAVMMELAFLMRARKGEILALRREHVTDRGIFLERSKNSESEVTLWTPRLRDAYKAATAINRGVISPWLLHGKDGDAIKPEAFSTAWQRLMAKALENGLKERFTFHDLKAKGLTDDSEHWAGHKSERMRQVYHRLAREKQATR